MKKIVAILLTVAFFAISLGASSSEDSLSQVQIQKVTSESGFTHFRLSGIIRYSNGDPAPGFVVYVQAASGIKTGTTDSCGSFYVDFPCDDGFTWGIAGLTRNDFTCVMTRTYGHFVALITLISR